MTAQERADMVLERCGKWPVGDVSAFRAWIRHAIEDAEAARSEACVNYIEEQNRMVKDLLGGNLHDAFVADITKGIRERNWQ